MLCGCVGGIAVAQQTISSGLASIGIGTVPIWTALISGIFKRTWPNRFEVIGISLGTIGLVMLNIQGGLSGTLQGSIIIALCAFFWSLGSVLSQHIDLPVGAMAYAGEMLAGGTVTILFGVFMMGERFNFVPNAQAFWAWVYLVIAGSLGAYSAYMYLLNTVQTSIATSYTLVTPVIALLLGVLFLSEKVTGITVIAVSTVLVGVWFIFRGREFKSQS
jgi:drug/metabolite transporter (DMT)-like permease